VGKEAGRYGLRGREKKKKRDERVGLSPQASGEKRGKRGLGRKGLEGRRVAQRVLRI
jgi:hypothetical protein